MKRQAFFLIAIAVSFFAAIPDCYSQTAEKHVYSREQLWLGYFNQTRLTKRLGIWFDIHYRRTDNFTERSFQFLIRPAVTYFIKDNLRFNVGYVFANHFPSKGFETSRPEHRPWQQILWNQKYPGLITLQSLRFEQRFNRKITNDVLQDDYNFNYRLRYNMAFYVPLKGKEIVAKTPFVIIANEVFVNFGKQVVYNTFDQNRFFVGLGYQITAHTNVHLGYMNIFQQETSGNNYLSTHAIRIYLYHSFDLRNTNDSQE